MRCKPAQASGTVNPSVLYWGGSNATGYNCAGLTSLGAVQSCELAWHDHLLASDLIWLNSLANATNKPLSCPTAVLTDSGPSGPYVDVFQITYYRGSYNVGGFWIPIYYLFCNGPRVVSYYIFTRSSCPINSTGTTTCTCTDPYVPDAAATSCVPVLACPEHASGTPCACDAGYEFDTTRTSCISTCPVSDLPEVTDPEILPFENNPDLSDTARLTPRMQTALSCLQTAAAAGSPSVGSAYRPPAYNQHLIDVWKKWFELENGENSANPACADRKAKIRGHFQRHKLLESQQPVPGSLHTLGEAVDVTISLPPANIDALAAGCQLRRPKPVKDRVHFIHQ